MNQPGEQGSVWAEKKRVLASRRDEVEAAAGVKKSEGLTHAECQKRLDRVCVRAVMDKKMGEGIQGGSGKGKGEERV